MDESRLTAFLGHMRSVDGHHALSDDKVASMSNADHVVSIEEDDEIQALGVAARHPHSDGSEHWAVETALLPGLRFPEFEDILLERALSLVPGDADVSVWSRRSSLDSALARRGFVETRGVAYYVVDLPLAGPRPEIDVRAFRESDISSILAVHAAAFDGHREVSSLDGPAFDDLRRSKWFDPAGLLIATLDERVVAFCWTRVHSDGDGEIYRIAVDPSMQGRGFGRTMVLAGFAQLAQDDRVRRGALWVDRDNSVGISLYRDLGMTEESVNREFQRVAAS